MPTRHGNSGIAATASICPKPSRVPTVAKTIASIAQPWGGDRYSEPDGGARV